MSDIKNGDLVTFKSGSPPLTVMDVYGDLARVAWFNDVSGKFEGEEVPSAYLVKFNSEADDHE